MNVLEQTIAFFSPLTALKRQSAKRLLERSYQAASTGRRIQDWRTNNSSANTEILDATVTIRNRARDLRRNNSYASRIIQGFSTNIIGTGIVPTTDNEEFLDLINNWADSVECSSDDRLNLYGIQQQVVEALVESGEVLIIRQYDKSKTIPLTLKILEADYLDHTKDKPEEGLYQGIQLDDFGKPLKYWLYDGHPDETGQRSTPISAEDVIHIYRADRPGQVRGISWLSPVIIQLHKLQQYEDALLEKLLISNLYTGFIFDSSADSISTETSSISLEPGAMVTLPPGKSVEFSQPPDPGATTQHFLVHLLRSISTSLGFPYELLSGNLSEVNFSTARISFNEFTRIIESIRWTIIIPIFLNRIWHWFYETSTLANLYSDEMPEPDWTPPRRISVDFVRENPVIIESVRGGLLTLSEAIREQGYNPKKFLKEYENDMKLLDEYNLTLSSDVRKDSLRKTSPRAIK